MKNVLKRSCGLFVKMSLVKISAHIVVCVLCCGSLYAQVQTVSDTLITHEVAETTVIPPNVIEWELLLRNTSRRPYSWANGTFFLTLSGIPMSVATMRQAELLLDSSALPLEPASSVLTGERTSRTGYSIKTRLVGNRIAVAVIGADSVQNCVRLQPESAQRVARLRVVLPDSLRNPNLVRVAWVIPARRFQASAVKLDRDSLRSGVRVFRAQDNVELVPRLTTDSVVVERPPDVQLRSFSALYGGDKRVNLVWNTAREGLNTRRSRFFGGFVVLRAVKPSSQSGVQNGLPSAPLRFTDTITTFFRNPALQLQGATNGQQYTALDTTVERANEYVYELRFVNISRQNATTLATAQYGSTFLGTDSTFVPNAILRSAVAAPNPFANATTIEYTLADRAIVRVQMFDATGKLVGTLLEDTEQPRDTYKLPIDGTALPHQGLYVVVVTARAVNDTAVEQTQAVVKLQLVR